MDIGLLAILIAAIPVGATLSDGTHTFTASASTRSIIVSKCQLDRLSSKAPTGHTGTFTLQETAMATETANGDSQSTSLPLTVSVLPTNFASPIILDLNGDGVQTLDINATNGRFDLLNTGNAIRSGWISKEDAFLAIDTNGNGKIDDRSELFGGEVGEGFAKLAGFDSNGDGQVDKYDARFNELRLWQDRDSDHQTDAGGLQSLTDARIAALSVSYRIKAEQQNGNWVLERSTATTSDGRSIEIADAYFQVDVDQGRQASTIASAPRTSGDIDRLIAATSATATPRAEARITVQSTLPVTKPFAQLQSGTVAQPFAQRATNNSILLIKPMTSKWFDELSKSNKSKELDNSVDRELQDNPPVIDWTRNGTKARKDNPFNAATKLDKHRNSKWVAEFVNGRDNHADGAKLDALKITLPTTVSIKGK